MGLPVNSSTTAPSTPIRKRTLRRLDSDSKSAPPKKARQCETASSEKKTIATEAERLPVPEGEQYPLLARESECEFVDNFLVSCLTGAKRRDSCLYLSGRPGTGKTCCARGSARALRQQRPETRLMEFNCMELQQCSLSGLLLKIIDACSAASPSASIQQVTARTPLSAIISAATEGLAALGGPVILIIDEVDQLVRRPGHQRGSAAGSETLEQLFSLPVQPSAPALALVAIANAVDLLARAASPAIKGLCRSLLFEPYSADQLRAIAKARFNAKGSQGEAAVKALGRSFELQVRQTAKGSGDCRHVVRMVEDGLIEALRREESGASDGAPKPAPAKKTTRNYDPLAGVKDLPMEQQVLLCALASGTSEATRFSEVFQRYKALLTKLRQPLDCASKPQVGCALAVFEQRGLLSLSKPKGRNSGKSLGTPGPDSVVQLAVLRKSLQSALGDANPMLQQCVGS
eukprot:TRINITY_DN35016_c0_g1_i1.p1 TRINITY_DN35016_c0_g1~~TRINITY_DN35016_c0_g1_i1.p1  ORF type:complete len:461 (-),score=82.01 TRINITY_DN35016_c0_g1_i1:262-1644(-)